MTDIFDWLGDALVPKEIAPYLGMIAPMVAPQLGITGSLALSQLGSWKERAGKFDPYSALATGIALSTPHARDIRRAGRLDPSKGTIGQRMSAGFADTGILGGVDSAAYRAFDPRMSIREGTFFDGSGNKIKSYWESPSMALDKNKQWGIEGKWKDTTEGKTIKDIVSKDIKHINKQGYNFSEDWQGALDWMDKDPSTDVDYYKGQKAWARYEPEGKPKIEYDADGNKIGYSQTEGRPYAGNLSEKQKEAYMKAVDKGGQSAGQAYLEKLGRVKPQHQASWYETAGDFGSELSGAIMPGFSQYDDQGRRIPETFDFAKAAQTISVAGTLGSVMALKDELEKEELKDEEEERKIWSEWFQSYERTAGHTYEFSPYREEHLWEIYQKYMMAKGGRVGYNMGGGIMEAPGVPQGMQLDGRNGAFVSQGIEEKADDVPAMLSKNEFVLTADAMRGLDKMMGGSGDPRAAAKYMYQTMDQLEAMA